MGHLPLSRLNLRFKGAHYRITVTQSEIPVDDEAKGMTVLVTSIGAPSLFDELYERQGDRRRERERSREI